MSLENKQRKVPQFKCLNYEKIIMDNVRSHYCISPLCTIWEFHLAVFRIVHTIIILQLQYSILSCFHMIHKLP